VLALVAAATLPAIGSAGAQPPAEVQNALVAIDLLGLPDEAITSPPSPAELEDLEVAAEQYGLSMEEAINQFGWRDNFGLLAREISRDFPRDYFRAESIDGATAWIGFAGDAPAGAVSWLRSFERAFPGVTVLFEEGFGMTAVELSAAVQAIHYEVLERPGVLDATTEYWRADGVVRVTVAAGDRTADSSAFVEDSTTWVEDLGRRHDLVAELEIFRGTQLTDLESSSHHYGGEVLRRPQNNVRCTSGFTVRTNSPTSGTRGVVTAGHCHDDPVPGQILTDDGPPLTYQSQHQGAYGDFQWRTRTTVTQAIQAKFYSGSTTVTEVNLRDVTNENWALPGDYLCTNGVVTHKTCDTVHNIDVCGSVVCSLFSMQQRLTERGDSGAPVYIGNGARGIHRGGQRGPATGGVWRSVRSQTSLLPTALGVHVATS
jgi:streptogrisin C